MFISFTTLRQRKFISIGMDVDEIDSLFKQGKANCYHENNGDPLKQEGKMNSVFRCYIVYAVNQLASWLTGRSHSFVIPIPSSYLSDCLKYK